MSVGIAAVVRLMTSSIRFMVKICMLKQAKIGQALETEQVEISDTYGDGRHVSIDVTSPAFEGLSSVKRQRMVYKVSCTHCNQAQAARKTWKRCIRCTRRTVTCLLGQVNAHTPTRCRMHVNVSQRFVNAIYNDIDRIAIETQADRHIPLILNLSYPMIRALIRTTQQNLVCRPSGWSSRTLCTLSTP